MWIELEISQNPALISSNSELGNPISRPFYFLSLGARACQSPRQRPPLPLPRRERVRGLEDAEGRPGKNGGLEMDPLEMPKA